MIPFVDLKAQYRTIEPEIREAVGRVLESGGYVLGREVAAFENEFAAFCGVEYGVAVNSGTSALHLALLAAGVGPGDEVVTTPFTFVATVAAIRYTGATPVFVDVEPASLTIDPTRLARAITAKTKAVVPVHLYGQAAEMTPIDALARAHGLAVIEDACQAHGARYGDRPVGSLGRFGCFSFYPGKNLGAYGEGGIVVTDDGEAAGRLRMLRDWGASRKYHHELPGFNYRMEALQGAILRVKLHRLAAWNEARRRHAAVYDRGLAGCGVALPAVLPGREHVYHVYAVRSPERDRLQALLKEAGIETGIHYPIPVHLQKAYADPRYPAGSFPHAERAANEVLSLPMFPELTAAQLHEVVTAVGRASAHAVLRPSLQEVMR